MMKNTRPEEENIIKDIRNLYRFKEQTCIAIKDIRNFFELKKMEIKQLKIEKKN